VTAHRISDFTAGDVVLDVDEPEVLGLVTEVRLRGLTVVWGNGGRVSGPGLLAILRHHEPRLRVDVPAGALGNRGWNREQAVTAALRRAQQVALADERARFLRLLAARIPTLYGCPASRLLTGARP